MTMKRMMLMFVLMTATLALGAEWQVEQRESASQGNTSYAVVPNVGADEGPNASFGVQCDQRGALNVNFMLRQSEFDAPPETPVEVEIQIDEGETFVQTEWLAWYSSFSILGMNGDGAEEVATLLEGLRGASSLRMRMADAEPPQAWLEFDVEGFGEAFDSLNCGSETD